MNDPPEAATTSRNATPPAEAPQPPDPPTTPLAIGGMIIWALLGLLTLASRDWLADHGHGSWPWICLAGFLLGLPGLAVMRRHDAGRLRRAANRRQSIRPLRRDPRDAP